MNCAEMNAKIEILFDGAATPSLKGDIEAHLSACPTCAAYMARLQAIRGLLLRTAIPAPSASMDVQVMRAFHDRRVLSQKHHAKWRNLVFGSVLIPKPALAMSVIVLGVTLLVGFQIGKTMATQIVMPGLPQLTVSSASAPPSIAHELGDKRRRRAPSRTAAARNRTRQLHRPAGGESLARTSTVNPLESFTTVSPAGTNYSTRASLDGFEPFKGTKIRVIKGEEQR